MPIKYNKGKGPAKLALCDEGENIARRMAKDVKDGVLDPLNPSDSWGDLELMDLDLGEEVIEDVYESQDSAAARTFYFKPFREGKKCGVVIYGKSSSKKNKPAIEVGTLEFSKKDKKILKKSI